MGLLFQGVESQVFSMCSFFMYSSFVVPFIIG